MKIIFSDRENQHLHGTPAAAGVRSEHWRRPYLRMTFPLVEWKTLTNPRVRGNLLVKYENMILVPEEAVCVCPRCRRTSGTTLRGTRSPACCRRSGAILATPATCCRPWYAIRS